MVRVRVRVRVRVMVLSNGRSWHGEMEVCLALAIVLSRDCLIMSCDGMPGLVTVLSCLVIVLSCDCLVLPCLVLSCDSLFLPCLVLSCDSLVLSSSWPKSCLMSVKALSDEEQQTCK